MNLTDPYQLAMFLIGIVTLFLQLFVLFLVVKKSPKSMELYKKYLCITTILELLFSANYSLVLLYSYPVQYPGLGMFVNGLANFGGEQWVPFFASLNWFLGASMLLSQDVNLVFRYLSVHPNEQLRNTFVRWPCTLIVYSFLFLLALTVSVAYYHAIAPVSEYESIIHNWSSTTTNLPIDYTVTRVLLRTNQPYLWIFIRAIGFALITSELAYLFIVLLILRILKQQTSSMSRRSVSLHRQLTLCLAANIIVPFCAFVIPFISVSIQVNTKPTDNRFRVQLSTLCFSAHSAITALLTIFFISPYRQFVVRKLRRFAYPKHFTSQIQTVQTQFSTLSTRQARGSFSVHV